MKSRKTEKNNVPIIKDKSHVFWRIPLKRRLIEEIITETNAKSTVLQITERRWMRQSNLLARLKS